MGKSQESGHPATTAALVNIVNIVNIIDIEATCWPGRAPAGQVSDIIEIGLTVVDLAAGERLARHQIVVRPARSTVSGFCTELTGWTQEQVDAGVGFAEACETLRAEHGSGARLWASWGDYDRRQFERQCAQTGVPYPFGTRHVNVKAAFARARDWEKGVGMHEALAVAGLPLEGRHHCGADDAWNIAALALGLAADGDWPAV